MAGAIGAGAFGQPISAGSPSDDDLAARRYDRERRFAETAFGRIAHIDRGTATPMPRTRATQRLTSTCDRSSPRRSVRRSSTATHWVSLPIRFRVLSRCCVNAPCRRVWSGAWETPSFRGRTQTISAGSCRGSRVFGESIRPSCSFPKNIRISSPRRRGCSGSGEAVRLDSAVTGQQHAYS